MTRWTTSVTRMLHDALAAKLTEATEEHAIDLDGGAGGAAVAAAMAVPAGPEREAQIALWSKRIVAAGGKLAFQVSLATSADEILTIARITARVRALLGGAR